MLLRLTVLVLVFAIGTPGLAQEKEGEPERPISHLVKKGETLSGILIDAYGFSARQYRQAIPLFKKLNPRTRNINIIFYGTRILIPRMSRPALPKLKPAPPSEALVEPSAPAPLPPLEERLPKPAADDPSPLPAKAPLGPTLRLEQVSEFNLREAAEEIFPKMGLAVKTSGDTTLELSPYGRVRIDNRRFPLVELPGNKNLILDYGAQFPRELKRLVEASWPNYKVVIIDQKKGLNGLVAQVFADSEYFSVSRNQEVVFGEEVKLILKGDWKIESTGASLLEGKVSLLNLVEEGHLPTSKAVRNFARDYGIELIELEAGGPGAKRSRPARKNNEVVVTLNYDDVPSLVDQLLLLVGQDHKEKSLVKLKGSSWAGVEVEFMADKFLRRGEQIYVIDFSGLPAELVKFASDYNVTAVTVPRDAPFQEVVSKVYGGMDITYAFSNYRLFANLEKVPSYYDIEVPGFLISHRIMGLRKSEDHPDFTYFPAESDSFLLTNAKLSPGLRKILEEEGFVLKKNFHRGGGNQQ